MTSEKKILLGQGEHNADYSAYYVADCSFADVDNDGDMDIILPDAHDNPPAEVAREMRASLPY